MSRRRYRIGRVNAELKSERRSRWKIRENPLVSGIERVYSVTDNNSSRGNSWEFIVRVPNRRGEGIEFRQSVVAKVRVLEGIEGRALVLARVMKDGDRGGWYGMVALADPQ